ncbi:MULTISPECIES: GNAT family N-acetyltransferase [Streptacidiphilus]|uniref:N-acetyltransferase family protein n=1 Tax=Streptacidiphilus cavernicola TaxID=3342716 RepID=A0ABV6UKQ3_9ACTN|nr:GNAT family N-acetyltransferase [Streptacidiphilus jeojiense]
MRLTIERATEGDAETIALMLGEIERYYGGAYAVPDVKQVRHALFGPQPTAIVLLARDGVQVVGLASVCFLWPAAGADTSLYLKELYVRETYRLRGVARKLMIAVHCEARSAGCSRVEWTADRGNPAAVALYAALGVEPHEGKIFYRSQM